MNQNVGALEEQTAAEIDAHLGVNMQGRCRITMAIWSSGCVIWLQLIS
jgi:hypothetical protein